MSAGKRSISSGTLETKFEPQSQFLSVATAAEQIRARKLSPVELTEQCLSTIARLNPQLNAFITVTPQLAREQARAAESEISNGHYRGPLHGIPIALKDILDTAGIRTTAASALFESRIPSEDAEVVRRLRAAGAVFVGKTNLHEFAYGGSGVLGHFGAARNPWNPERTPGGSSSGSAVAVAAGMCCAAIGTDTAGSIRLPAAYCGLTGFKPSYGLVSARGVLPLAWSYDHVGPIARTAEDCALVLNAIAAFDPDDLGRSGFSSVDYAAELNSEIKSLRLGVPRDYFFAQLDPDIASAVEQAISVLGRMTAGVREISFAVDEDRVVSNCEAYAYHLEHVQQSPEKFHPETLRRIRTGERVTGAEYALKRRELEQMRRSAHRIFEDCDLVVTPTTPIPPPTIAELEQNPLQLRPVELLMLRNTRPFNVLGLPAISVPCGLTRDGMPIGLQIAGPSGGDALVVRMAHVFQRGTEWHLRNALTGYMAS